MAIVLTQLRNKIHCDMISKKRNGNIIFRNEFYYRHGKTAFDNETDISKQLREHNFNFKLINSGEVWKAFNGGASTANSSHWWVEVKINTN